MGLPPWETSDSQFFALITGANSGLGHSISTRLIEEFLTSPNTPSNKHLILILCTRAPLKTRYAISRLRGHLRGIAENSPFATDLRKKAKNQGIEYRWENTVNRVHFIGVEVDLCDLKSVYALANKLVNGTVGSPDATTMDGLRLPHGSPGTQSFSKDILQDRWALAQEPGSAGAQRSWGWGLSGIKIPRLDAVILNAGFGGWVGIDYVFAVKEILLDLVDAVTWPAYKISKTGELAKPQSTYKLIVTDGEKTQPLTSDGEKSAEPPLGNIFCSNVFGHYILAHELMPLLSQPASKGSHAGGKIIWQSSIEAGAYPNLLDVDDIQGIKSSVPYESSKRLLDILALSSELPSVKRIAATYFDPRDGATSNERKKKSCVQPRVYVTHPGIFASEILPLNAFLVAIYKFVFLVARWLGSPWHTIGPDKAAVAPVWVALADEQTVDSMHIKDSKWGSGTDRSGNERVLKTDVPGWGWNGTVEETKGCEQRIGRRKNGVDVTKEMREEFEVLGGKCWKQMEDLRREWEGVLKVKQ